MNRTVTLNLTALHPGQQQLRAERRRFNIACCGRRFGKTLFGLDELLFEPGGAIDGHPVAWFAPLYKMLLEPWRDAKRLLAPLTIARGLSEQEKRIELVTGGSITFWSLSDYDAVRGRKYAKIVVDEAAMVRGLWDAWTLALRPLLTDYRGGAWFFSTGKGPNDFKRIYDHAGNRPNEWARWQLPTEANPYIDPEEIEAARLELPPLAFAQEYLAQFVDMAGSVILREWLRYGDPLEKWKPEQLAWGMGVDLAISLKEQADYTAAVLLARDPEGKRYVMDAARGRFQFNGVLEFIKGMAEKWSRVGTDGKRRTWIQRLAVEEVQYQAAVCQELLRTTELPVYGFKPDRDKLTRFQPIVPRYEQGLIYHTSGLPPAFEAELLSFPPQTDDQHDDYPDAYVMAWDAVGGAEVGQTVAAAGDRVATTAGTVDEGRGFGTVSVQIRRGF